ncbi:translational machinery component [Lichtheimia hyalospora FSU 10163]|nr:translational machinery component [Lichtheimia hyalospora FSU 10163]
MLTTRLLGTQGIVSCTLRHFSTTRSALSSTTTTNDNSQMRVIFNALKENSSTEGEASSTIGSLIKNAAQKKKDVSDFDVHGITQQLHRASENYQLHINASPNNTIITLTRPNGSPLITTSGGSAGFKKAARSGYEAAHQAALQLLEKKATKNLNPRNIHVILKGFGPGREAAFKALAGEKWNIKRITDATPVPFGGCRPKKARRL